MIKHNCERDGHCLHPIHDTSLPSVTPGVVACCWCGWQGEQPNAAVFAFPASYYAAGHGSKGIL